jgi:transcriptional regulator with XRE-family HTH domain
VCDAFVVGGFSEVAKTSIDSALRRAAGLTGIAVSRALNMQNSRLSALENGAVRASPRERNLLTEFYGLPFEVLMRPAAEVFTAGGIAAVILREVDGTVARLNAVEAALADRSVSWDQQELLPLRRAALRKTIEILNEAYEHVLSGDGIAFLAD